MKTLIFLTLIMAAPVFLVAQNTPLSRFYNDYERKPDFETKEIRPGAVGFEWQKDMDVSGLNEALKEIESLRMLTYKKDDKKEQQKLWKKMQKAAGDKVYAEVMTVKADNTEASFFMLREPASGMREFAIISKDNNGISLITVNGTMNFRRMMNPELMEGLREMGKYHMKNKGGECIVR